MEVLFHIFDGMASIKGTVSFAFFWKLCVIISFWCCAIYLNRGDQEFFCYLERWARNRHWMIYKPLTGCINCMASFHSFYITGLVFYLLDMPASLFLQTWVPAAFVCSLLNGILFLIHGILEEKFIETHYKNDANERNKPTRDSGVDS